MGDAKVVGTPGASATNAAGPPGVPGPALPRPGWHKPLAWVGAVLSVVYVLNPTFGLFEFLPDALPGVGNLDESAATLLFLKCVSVLRRR